MKILQVLLCIALLSGCVTSSGYVDGPNGKPIHFIDGMSASVAYTKAKELCPAGYTIIGTPQQTSGLDYVMTIECK